MSFRTKASLLGAATLSVLAWADIAQAQGFYIQTQSTRAAGRAFSGEAADTGAASLWWNPASIADMADTEVTLSVSSIQPTGQVEDRGTTIRRPGQVSGSPVGGNLSVDDPIENGIVPSLAIAVPFGRLAFGLAVTAPYNSTTDYDENDWTRYSADRTKVRTIDIQPSVALAVTDWLRVGGAVNVEYADATLSNALPNLAAALPDGHQELRGNGWDVGWSAGVQLHNERVTVGIAYKSAVKHRLNGEVEITGLLGPLAARNGVTSDVEATYTTPAQIIVGGRFRATDALTLNAQGVRFTWNQFDAIRLGAPLNTALPQNYRNSWSLAGGADYAVTPALTLRAGVQRAITPTRDGFRDARVSDANRWYYAAGASYDFSRRFGIDAAFNYVNIADASIDRPTAAYLGTPAATSVLTNGALRDVRSLTFSLGGRVTF